MKKKITREWLNKIGACHEAIDWIMERQERDSIKIMTALMADKKYEWANWGIVRLMNKRQRVQYAIFAAESVLHIFEKTHPNDKSAANAINAAKAYLKRPCKRTKAAARAAARAAAWAAARDAARAAAWAAAWDAAWDAAWAAAWDAAWAAAWDAAWDAVWDAARDAAWTAMMKKILEYGMSLLNMGAE